MPIFRRVIIAVILSAAAFPLTMVSEPVMVRKIFMTY